jgi:hypothetical protein
VKPGKQGKETTVSEGQTEHEALLEARVKELEAASALHESKDASAGMVDQVSGHVAGGVREQ